MTRRRGPSHESSKIHQVWCCCMIASHLPRSDVRGTRQRARGARAGRPSRSLNRPGLGSLGRRRTRRRRRGGARARAAAGRSPRPAAPSSCMATRRPRAARALIRAARPQRSREGAGGGMGSRSRRRWSCRRRSCCRWTGAAGRWRGQARQRRQGTAIGGSNWCVERRPGAGPWPSRSNPSAGVGRRPGVVVVPFLSTEKAGG